MSKAVTELVRCPRCGAWYYPEGREMATCWRCKEEIQAVIAAHAAEQRGSNVDITA